MPRAKTTSSIIVVLVTCPTWAVARNLADKLLKRRLAACVNALATVESTFRWKGKIERCREIMLLIKTTSRRFDRLKQTILTSHPYEVPEILALPVIAGYQPYLRWVSSSISTT